MDFVGDAQLGGVKMAQPGVAELSPSATRLPGQCSLQHWQGRRLVPISQLEICAVSNIPIPSQPSP